MRSLTGSTSTSLSAKQIVSAPPLFPSLDLKARNALHRCRPNACS
jgi:hypothetical protein